MTLKKIAQIAIVLSFAIYFCETNTAIDPTKVKVPRKADGGPYLAKPKYGDCAIGVDSCQAFDDMMTRDSKSDVSLGHAYGMESGDSRCARPDGTYFYNDVPQGIKPLNSFIGYTNPHSGYYNEDLNDNFREEYKMGDDSGGKGWPTYNTCIGDQLMFNWIDPTSLDLSKSKDYPINITNTSQNATLYAALYYVGGAVDDNNDTPANDYPGLMIRVEKNPANPDTKFSVKTLSAIGGALGISERLQTINFNPIQKMGACRLWLLNHAASNSGRGRNKDARCCDCKWSNLVLIVATKKELLKPTLTKAEVTNNANNYQFIPIANAPDNTGAYTTSAPNVTVGVDNNGNFTIGSQ